MGVSHFSRVCITCLPHPFLLLLCSCCVARSQSCTAGPPDTMKQLPSKPHLTVPHAPDDVVCSALPRPQILGLGRMATHPRPLRACAFVQRWWSDIEERRVVTPVVRWPHIIICAFPARHVHCTKGVSGLPLSHSDVCSLGDGQGLFSLFMYFMHHTRIPSF